MSFSDADEVALKWKMVSRVCVAAFAAGLFSVGPQAAGVAVAEAPDGSSASRSSGSADSSRADAGRVSRAAPQPGAVSRGRTAGVERAGGSGVTRAPVLAPARSQVAPSSATPSARSRLDSRLRSAGAGSVPGSVLTLPGAPGAGGGPPGSSAPAVATASASAAVGFAAVTAVASPAPWVASATVRVAQVFDSVEVWLSGLPASPVTDFLSGALLLVRRTLLPGVPQIPTVRVTDSAVVEGDGGEESRGVFTVALDRAYASAVTVAYSTSGAGSPEGVSVERAVAGVDYIPTSGTLTFAPGQISQQVSVAVLGDDAVESTEEFVLAIFAALPAGGARAAAEFQPRASAVADQVIVTDVVLGTGRGIIFNDDVAEAVSSANVDLANWMSTLPGIADLPLTALPIPGTHDSGSYAITRESPWALTGEADFDPWVRSLWFSRDIAAAGGKTQATDIFAQLVDGIRYVDLRLSNERDGVIYIEHGLRGPSIDDVLEQIRRFAEARPDEVVLVNMARFTNFDSPTHAQFIEKIRQTLGTRLAPDTLGASATLTDFWAADRNIVVLYNDKRVANDVVNADLWSYDVFFNPYGNVPTADALLEKNRQFLEDWKANHAGKIWEMFGTVTPNAETYVRGIFGLWGWLAPDSIESLMRQVHPALQDWLRNEFRDSFNVVSTDWYSAQWARGSFVRDVLGRVDGAYL